MSECIDPMEAQLTAICEWMRELTDYINSEAFQNMRLADQSLAHIQLSALHTCWGILSHRISDARAQALSMEVF